MLRLLIVGCGDVVMRALPQLLRRYRVYALVRDARLCQPLRQLGVTPLLADLDRPSSLHRLAGLADHVIHSAPPQNMKENPGRTQTDVRTRRLRAALSRRSSLPRRLVYISTSGVYGDCQGAVVKETRKPNPQTIRAQRRVDAEAVLRCWGRKPAGPTVSLLRAPGIYAANRLPLERIRRGEPVLCREEDAITNHVHADDLARSVVAALRRGRAQRIYHVSDNSHADEQLDGRRTPLHMADWFDLVADHAGLPRPPRVCRAEAEQQLSALRLSFMNESRQLDNTRLRRELGVRLAWPDVRAGLAALASPAVSTLSPHPVSPEKQGELPCSG